MATARDVATFLGYFAANYAEPEPLSDAKLQKLLYYAQVWSIDRHGVPLFEDRMEAWSYGPVVPGVSEEYERERGGIFTKFYGGDESDLTDEERKLVSEVYLAYLPFSAARMGEFVRQESPWIGARGSYGSDVRSQGEITPRAIQAYIDALEPVA